MTIRAPLLAAMATALAVLVPAAQSAGQAEPPTLLGTVGPGPQITLTTADGQPVTTLLEGTYTINVSDKSANHNFHLFGPDLNQTTTVAQVTDTTWTVTLKPGGYAFVCDPHQAGGMRGTFAVVEPRRRSTRSRSSAARLPNGAPARSAARCDGARPAARSSGS